MWWQSVSSGNIDVKFCESLNDKGREYHVKVDRLEMIKFLVNGNIV